MQRTLTEKKRQAWAEMMKSELAQAVAKLFVQKGYTQTTMDDIAEAIGMSKANLYNYVESKDVLIFVILEHHVKLVENVFNAIRSLPPDIPVLEKLRKFIKEYIEVVDKCQNETIALHHAVVRLNKEGRHKFLVSANWMFEFVDSLLKEGVKSGEFRPIDTKMLSVNIVEICTDWARLRWYLKGLFTLDTYIRQQTELVEFQLLKKRIKQTD